MRKKYEFVVCGAAIVISQFYIHVSDIRIRNLLKNTAQLLVYF
jgi:hypothetical protein